MIDDFLEEQKIITNILKNAVKKNKLSHAYLFETNEYQKKEDFALAFVKYLLCPNQYTNKLKCGDCKQCENIDKKIFSEVKHIYPDGLWIKKEQLLDLQNELSKTSVQAKKRVYIIHNAECLNTSAANSILKFLEEPEDNIIAILITDNIHQLLDTIISRCQIVSFSRDNLENKTFIEKVKLNININQEIQNLTEEEFKEKIKKILDFILFYENNLLDTLLYTQKKFHNKFMTKNEVLLFLEVTNLFYLDVIKYKFNNNINIFNEYKKEIIEISLKNDINEIYKKINIILSAKEHLKYNINTNLLIDKMLIDMEGSYE